MSQLTYICEQEQNTSHLFSPLLIKSIMSSRSMSFIIETKSATVQKGIRAKMTEVVVLLFTLASCWRQLNSGIEMLSLLANSLTSLPSALMISRVRQILCRRQKGAWFILLLYFSVWERSAHLIGLCFSTSLTLPFHCWQAAGNERQYLYYLLLTNSF